MAKGNNKTGKKVGKSGRQSRLTRTLDMLARREPLGVVIGYGTAPTTAGVVVNLTQIAQGDALNTRSGDKVWVEQVRLRCNILATATSNWRYIVFRDRFGIGTTPAVTDVLTAANVAAHHSTINVIQQKRFTILLDKTISFSAAGKLSDVWRKNITVNQPTYYDGASATTNKASGQIYLLLIADVATPGNHDFESQIIYSDF